MFVYHQHGKTVVLLLYVDDIILTGSDSEQFKHLIAALSSQFSMKDLGHLHYFLGIQVEKTETGMFLNQKKYSEDILHIAGMYDCNLMPTPLPLQLFSDNQMAQEMFPQPSYFQSLAGKLQYLTLTRPNIQFAVNFVCLRMHQPTQSDFNLLKRILRHLKGTMAFGIHINKNSTLVVSAFSDSDSAGCKETRRSTTSFCTYLGPNLASWSAKRQSTVSRSSTEAEYRALAETSAELTWLASLLRDIGIPQDGPAVLYCDNLSAVHLTTNPAFHACSKHFETDWHYTRERVALGFIETRHIPAIQQIADIFTKSLPRASFERLRDKLGVGLSTISSLRGGKETNALLCETETLKKVEKIRRPNVSQTSVKSNTGPSAWTHHNGHKNCEAELAQKTKSRHLPLVLKNRFDSLLTVENEDKIATCRALCV